MSRNQQANDLLYQATLLLADAITSNDGSIMGPLRDRTLGLYSQIFDFYHATPPLEPLPKLKIV